MNVVPRSTGNTNGETENLIYTSELILCFTIYLYKLLRLASMA